MRRNVLFALIALLATASLGHAADKPSFLMEPVEPPPGWEYSEKCKKVGEANGKTIMGGPNCVFVEKQPSQNGRTGQSYDRPHADRDRDYDRRYDGRDNPVEENRRAWARYCRDWPWAPACRQQPVYAYAAPAVDWRGVEYLWGKVLGERPRRGWHRHHWHHYQKMVGGGHYGSGGRDPHIGSSGGYDPRNPSGGYRR